MKFKSSYGEIYCEISGQGKPLVMIHGTPFSSEVWKIIRRELAGEYQIFTFDLLGYGKSEKAEHVALDVQNMILSEILSFWKLEKPAVVAHDFGGATLLRNIALNGGRFEKIILIDVVALSPWGSPFVQHVRHHEEVFNGIPQYIHRAMVAAYIRDALFSKVGDEEIEFLIEPWLGETGQQAFYRQIAQMDERYTREVEKSYSNIDVPVKILWGENDRWIPIEKGRELHSLIPGSQFVSASSCGHLVQIDRPDIILDEIRSFI